MGVPLPKPVMIELLERTGNLHYAAASACVNGFRDNMEDAHIAHLKDDWAFFGVFDGHANDLCSAYLAEAWEEYFNNNTMAMTDERLKEIALQLDKEFVSTRDGGSTATFFIASHKGPKVHLQVGNVGDSRVLIGDSRTGACVAMTTDHKPTVEEERRRIEDCGGHVEGARVDGSLAVSRAFGDRDYKQNGPDQLRQKVIALPDVTHIDVDFNGNQFAVLACDGVFEGEFSNEEVTQFVAQALITNNDLAKVASMVCHEAVQRGSKDNISCMVVLFKDGQNVAKMGHREVVAGPFSAPSSSNFRRAYAGMARKCGVTVGSLLEERYDLLSTAKVLTVEEEEELKFFNEGPPQQSRLSSPGSRTEWFENLFRSMASGDDDDDSAEKGIPLPMLMALLQAQGIGPRV